MTSAEKAAEYILYLSGQNAESDVTPLKLQKLLYFAEGLSLAIKGESLFPEELEAWQLGPVVPCVYNEYKYAGRSSIECPADFDGDSIGDDEKSIVKMTLDLYGQYAPWKLVEITHEEPPYIEAKNSGGRVINKETMKKFFADLVFQPMSVEEEDSLCEYLGQRSVALCQ